MFKNILIIGFGMIGSSIARSLLKFKNPPKIFAFDKSKQLHARLKSSKLTKINCLSSMMDVNKNNIDLIIICTPVLQYKKIFAEINSIDHHKIIVTDVGSTKSNIEKLYLKNKFTFNFVPSHPIAGIEKAGLEHGLEGLFKNRYNIICPFGKSKPSAVKKIANFWKKLGMQIEIMNSKDHDHVLGLTSHLPHLISYSLVQTAMKKEKSLNSKLVKFSAGGFRDFTRIAGSDPEMWRDIFLANNTQIKKLANLFISELTKLSKSLDNQNSKKLLLKLKNTKKVRNRIVKARQAGQFLPNG